MSERSARPATADNAGWNTGETGTETDPSAERVAGWAVDQVPGQDEFNYMFSLWGDFLQWLEDTSPREWTELSEGIAAAVNRQLFRVVPLSTGITSRLMEYWSVITTATGGLNPTSITTDGLKVYYVAGTGNEYIVAASPVDGSEVWEIQPSTGAGADITAMAADGARIFYVHSATPVGLRSVDTDGANALSGGLTYGHFLLRATGIHVAGISGNTGAGDVDIWTASNHALVATNATGSTQLRGVAIDEDYVYVGGDRNVSDVWAYKLVGGGLLWSVALDTGPNVPVVRAIAADGDCVYVLTDAFTDAAGDSKSLFCLDRTTGAILWSVDVDGTNMLYLAVDQGYLYAVNSLGTMYMISLKGQTVGIVKSADNVADSIAVDGTSIYCQDGATATNLRRIAVGGATKTFMRAAGTDNRRRPFFTLAVPVNERI